VNGGCGCESGYVLEVSNCEKCSFMCDSCDGTGALSCSTFGAWFYVFLVVLILIVAGIIFFIVVKIRRSRKLNGEDSEPLYEDERSKEDY
jgi:heme/copper-type cytochrome/quinol oxidase subunit 2